MNKATLAAVAASLAALAGCGKPTPGPASGAAPTAAVVTSETRTVATDVCSLISAADLEQVTGVKIGATAAREPSSAEAGACEYRHADTAQFGTSIVAATAVFKPDRVASQEKVWTSMLKTEPVTGLGDVARYNEMGSALFVRQGGKAVSVQVLDNAGGDAGRKTIAAKIASLLLAKS